MAEQVPESRQADFPFSDMLMPVEVAPQRTRAIVEMEEGQSLRPYGLIYLSYQGFGCLQRAKIITSRIPMARIEAYPHSSILPHPLDNFLEFCKPRPN